MMYRLLYRPERRLSAAEAGQIVTTRSQFSSKDWVFGTREIDNPDLLLLGGNIRVKDRNNTVKVGDQRSGLSRFPIARGLPETNPLFHFVIASRVLFCW